MSKNFITLPSTSRFPNRSPFCFQTVWVKRGYLRSRTECLCACRISLLKKVASSRFQVPGLFHLVTFHFLTIHFPINCMNVCVVVILIFMLVVLICLFSRTYRTSFWWRIRESNPWPSACKADALANWANPPGWFLIYYFWFIIEPIQTWLL